MQLQAASREDFILHVQPAYDHLCRAGQPDQLEVILTSPHYTNLNLYLSDDTGRGMVDVWLHGALDAAPPVITDSTLHISGGRVRLEHVVVRDLRGSGGVVDLRARERLEVIRCAVVGCQDVGWPSGLPIIHLLPAYAPKTPPRLVMRQCWIIDNSQLGEASLISCATTSAYAFGEIRVEGVAFLHNTLDAIWLAGGTPSVVFDNCFIHAAPNFTRISAAVTQLTLQDTVLVAQRAADVVGFGTTAGFQFPQLTRCTLFVEEPPPSDWGLLESEAVAVRVGAVQVPSVAAVLALALRGVEPDIDALEAACRG